MARRDTYKYHFKRGKRIIHTGITNDMDRREQEHKRDYGESGHITQVADVPRGKQPSIGSASRASRGSPPGSE